jgi:hypothetical protein
VDEEELITQMGLLLSQVRFSRLALENIERSTSKYAGLSITLAGAGTAALGAPPLLNGALKVHVVNLGDLAGASLGDTIFGILGGAGRFLGGFFGGLVGGTVSGFAFPYTVGQINSITKNITELLTLLGAKGEQTSDKGGTGFLGMLESLNGTLDKVRDVLTGATSAPGEAGALNVEKWVELARQVKPIINGLIIVAPLLTGTLASVLNRLPGIQNGVLDLLEFAVRNALRLRAVVFAVVIDTVALAGRLVSGVLGIVSTAVGNVIGSVFLVIRTALDAALEIIRLLGPGLATTVNQLIDFLNNDVVGTLNAIGDTALVKLIWHFTLTLPLILPALAHIKGITLSKEETDALEEAKKLGKAASTTAARPTILSRFPDFSTLISDADRKAAMSKLDDLGTKIKTETASAFGSASGAVTKSAALISKELAGMDAGLDKELKTRLDEAGKQADSVGAALAKAKAAKSGLPQVDEVAKRYEEWLAAGGLAGLMTAVRAQLDLDAAAKPPEESIVGRAALTAPAATPKPVPVEIDRIEIRLVKPKKEGAPKPQPAPSSADIGGDAADRGVAYVDRDLVAVPA